MRDNLFQLRQKPSRGAGAAALITLALLVGAISVPTSAAGPTAQTPWMPEQLDAWSTITKRTATEPTPVTNGVTASSEVIDSVEGRVPIHVVTADTTDPNVRIGTVVSNDSVVDPGNETLSSMAHRTGAVAGINGGYFKMHASGQAVDGEIVDGEIWKSPTPNLEGTVAVLDHGSVVYGAQNFNGTVTAGEATRSLTSINTLADATGDRLTMITPRLGAVAETWMEGPHVVAVGMSSDGGKTIQISKISTETSLDDGHYGLVGGDADSASGRWILDHVEEGMTITTSHEISPNNNIQQLIQGSGLMLKNGEVYDDPTEKMPSGLHPETAVGSTPDGRLVMVVIDGQRNAETALGVNWTHVASYLRSIGVSDAILLDGGGSSEMVVREPGDAEASIVNSPSDLAERPIANGLFIYSTAETPSAATQAFINDGAKLSTAVGAASEVLAYATDAAGNPSADPVEVTVTPQRLGTYADGVFTPRNKGAGRLTVRAGDATASISVKVNETFSELTITPDKLGLKNGASQDFIVSGSIPDGTPVTVEPSAVRWELDNTELGAMDPATGRLTAAGSGSGALELTATAGGVSATADVRVGVAMKSLVVADSPADWAMTVSGKGATTVQQGHPGETTDVPPGSTQTKALKVDFSFANTTEQNRIRLSPNNGAGVLADKNELGQVPENLYFKFKIDSDAPPQSWIVFNVTDAAGHYMGLWTALDPNEHYGKWVELSKSIKRGVFTDYPLTIKDISFVGQYATNASTGTFSLAELRVDYPAGAPADETPYEAISSNNPEWLVHEQDPADFQPGGQTFIMGSDAHLRAAHTDSTSALNVENMTRRIKGEAYTTSDGQTVAPLAEVARPEVTVSLGDTSDTGIIEDLEYGKAMWEGFGVPLYNVVGNHEISNGPEPANGNFYSVFGQDTHFAFTRPGVTFIGVDNSTGSIQGSDPQQVPAQKQFPWFVEQLDAAETPVVFVGIHMPIHDPSPSKTSQASNRWEAEQFLEIIQNYRAGNPDKRVVVLHGHSRGFANLVLDPQGNPADSVTGIPQLTIADVGTPPYYAADQGGFFHFGLLHVNADGTVQFAVEPMLKSVAIDQGAADSLQLGSTKRYTATAVNANGANIANPPVMPVADPMSHVWTSFDPAVATVDAVTGDVTAVSAGTTTIGVRAGGITATMELTVTG